MKLTEHYSGHFEAFRNSEGEQYARLTLGAYGYLWFKFDFITESYQSFDSEVFPNNNKRELQKELEEEYRSYINNKFYEEIAG